MSSGRECQFVQVTPAEWFYFLEGPFAPKNCWDWREHADGYGPFGTQDEAEQHLRGNHANPGGWGVLSLDAGRTTAALDETAVKLVTEARERNAAEQSESFRPRMR